MKGGRDSDRTEDGKHACDMAHQVIVECQQDGTACTALEARYRHHGPAALHNGRQMRLERVGRNCKAAMRWRLARVVNSMVAQDPNPARPSQGWDQTG